MAVRVQWVGYGRAAAEALRAELAAAKGGDALAPATVVVPSNHVGVAARRLLASGELGPIAGSGVGVVAVTFVTPYRLAELLGAPRLAASGRRPVSTPVIAAALRTTLRDAPGVFAPVAEHPATETALVAAYRELREVSSEGLDAIARRGRRASDVVRLHRATRAHLEPRWYDEQDLIRAAADAIASSEGAAAALGATVLYLPQRLTPHMLRMFGALGASYDLTAIVGTTGDARADAEVVAAVAQLAPGPHSPPARRPEAVVAPDRTRIVLVSDADEEVRAAVRHVVDAVRDGTPLDRVAILHASPEPYARLVHEHLAAAGIASNGPSVVPLAGRVAGRALLGLLALPERDFRRQDVFAWLTTAPVLRHGRPIPVAQWERVSRSAGVVAGRDQWHTRLTRLIDELERSVSDLRARSDPEGDLERRAAADERAARTTRDLRDHVVGLVDDLARAARQPRGWAAHARWAREKLHATVGVTMRHDDWPADERKAAERVEAALDRLAALDSVEGAVDLDVFTRTLAIELESDLGRVGRFGDGVFVGPVGMGIGLDLDVVAVLGLAEGTFPAPVHDDSVLPDHEREAAGTELTLRRGRIDREHRELLAALAGAHRHVLGVPRGNLRRSTELVPSRWVLDFASALAGERWWADELFAATVEWIEPVASFDAGLRALSFPATAQEHRLRTLLVDAPTGAVALAAHAPDERVARSATVVAERRSPAFTRFDGNLAGVAVASPVDTIVSATRLQTWAACPFGYFMQYVLRAEVVENPEAADRISPLDKGSLVHEALEQFVVAVLARPAAEQPGPDDRWTPHDHTLMAEIGAERCADYEARGVTGRPIFWRRDRRQILRELDRFLLEDDDMRRGLRTRPFGAELAFGSDGTEPVPLALTDGRVLHFRGQADRVDRADDGGLLVLDYKTGSIFKFRGLSADDPDQGGRLLQLAVYGAAARRHAHRPDAPVRASYWFVSSGGDFAVEGYDVTPDVLERVGATLTKITHGIESGVFAAHPTAQSTSFYTECLACDPDELGVGELRRAWDRKRSDPALTPYAELAEPTASEGDDDG